jgi:RimJ/RimL family protein N-acetyltransferase
MCTLSYALKILERDRINNIGIINFIQNYGIVSVDIIGNSVLVKGISDRRWVYISCRDSNDLSGLKSKLGNDDLSFAVIDEWMIPDLTEGRNVLWDLTTEQYYLPENVQIPSYEHRTIPISAKDTDTVYSSSDYKEYISPEYVTDRIKRGISAGIYVDGKLVSWGITQDDGAIGFLHTIDIYRRKGYARSITLSIIESLRKQEKLPFAYVEPRNRRSADLLLKLGFKKNKTIHWFEIAKT